MAKKTVQGLADELKVSVKDITKKLEEDGIFGVGPEDSLSTQEIITLVYKITGKKLVVKKKETEEEIKAREEAERAKAAEEAKAKAEAERQAKAEAEAKAKAEAEARRARMKEEIEAEVKARAAAQNRAREEVREEVRAEAEAKFKAEEEARLKAEAEARAEAEAKAKAEAEAKAVAEAKAKQEAEAKAKQEAEARRTAQNNQNRGQNGQSRDGQNRQSRDGYQPRDGQSRDGQNRQSREGFQQRDGQNRGQGRDGQGRPAGQGGFQQRDGQNRGQGFQSKDGANRQGGQRPAGQGGRPGFGGGQNRGGSASMAELPKDNGKGNNRKADWNNKNKDKDNRKNQDEFTRRKNNAIPVTGGMDEDLTMTRHKKAMKRPQTAEEKAAAKAAEEEIKLVTLPETITVKDFADALHKPMPQIIKVLMGKGIMASMNQTIEFAQAEEIAMEMGILVEHQKEEDIFAAYTDNKQTAEDEGNLKERPPVVVVMGHVDHGKTSLLDAIRNSKVTEGEAGGITQHIGASMVEINGRQITFLDTPGHEAFTAMRLRGAMVTDIAILVVAADDGVMPQTIEAINHAKAAGVQIIVAINKIDKPTANPERIKQELMTYDLVAEDYGGSVICCPVSAKKREGIDELLENVLLTADILELKANPDCPATGTIIESELDKGRGAVATVLVQKGTLRVGDIIVSGSSYGRIKAMVDDKGRRVKEAGPSHAVEIIGLNEVPAAGEQLFVTPNEKEARSLAERVAARERSKMIEGNKKVSLDNLFGDIQSGDMKELNIIVKADVQGSVEAVKQSLEKLSTPEVSVKVIHGAVGAITDSDVMLASASNSLIIGFNVRPDVNAKSSAETEKVDVRLYRVIYNAIEDIQAAMKGMLDPKFEEKQLGHAEVRQVFKVSSVGTIAGSYVADGKITRSAKARLIRDNIVIYEGEIESLRRVKDDVKEVAMGYECGIMLSKFSDIKEGDVIEAFVMEEVER